MLSTMRRWLKPEIPFLLSAPAFVWQLLFFIVPLSFIIIVSFFSYDAQGFHIHFDHYRALFNALYFKIIFRSIILAFIVSFLCLLVGYPVAYYAALKNRRYKTLFLSFLILPFWTNLLVHIYAWFFVLEKNGFLNNFLLRLGLIEYPIVFLNNLFAVILVMFYCYLPFMILPIMSILEKFDTSLLEASLDLGATPRQTFFKIIVPLSYPGIQTGFFLVFVPAFAEFVIPLLLGGDKYMYVGTLIPHYFLVTQEQSMGTAFTVMSSVVLLVIAVVVNSYFRKKMK